MSNSDTFSPCSSQDIENENKEYWQKDEEVKECPKCHRSFNFVRRRSHCRSCGKIFCHDCNCHKIDLPKSFKWNGLQRVCDSCYLYLMNLETKKAGIITAKPDFEKVQQELFQEIEQILRVDESKWKETRNIKGITIEKLHLNDSNLYCFRTTVIINAPPNLTWNIYGRDELWNNWQTEANITILEQIAHNAHVIYITHRLPIVDNRDSCLYSFWRRGTFHDPTVPDTMCLFSRSINHPACPPSKQHVRCFCYVSFTTIEPYHSVGGTQTKLTSVLHFDPCGLIPAFFVNIALSLAIDSIEKMRSWIEKHQNEYPSLF